MTKQILSLLLFLLVFLVSVQAQEQNNPILYQTFIRNDGDSSNGGYVSILDALTLKELGQVDLIPSNPQRIELTADKKLAFVNNNPFVDDKKGMTVVDLGQRRVIRRMFENIGVYEMKLAPNGMMWILLDEPQQIAIVSPETLRVTERLTFNESPRGLIFSPDGKRAYVSLFTKDVIVLDATTRSRINIIQDLPTRNPFQIRPQELEISPDSKLLFISSKDTVSIVETRLFQVVSRFKINSMATGTGDLLLKISHEGKFLYVAGYIGVFLSIYDVNAKQIIKVLPVPFLGMPGRGTGTISYLQISPNNALLYLNQDFGITFLDTQTNSFIASLQTSTGLNFSNPFSLGVVATGDFSVGQ
ncbi:MAG: hypothetical protein FD167_4411, partial [bacterium]